MYLFCGELYSSICAREIDTHMCSRPRTNIRDFSFFRARNLFFYSLRTIARVPTKYTLTKQIKKWGEKKLKCHDNWRIIRMREKYLFNSPLCSFVVCCQAAGVRASEYWRVGRRHTGNMVGVEDVFFAQAHARCRFLSMYEQRSFIDTSSVYPHINK